MVSKPDTLTYVNFFVTGRIQEKKMKVEYFPTEMMIPNFYTIPLQGEIFRLFQNLILNLCEEDIRNMTNLDKLTKMETKIENADCVKAVKPAQECVVENEKVGSLNTVNHDVSSGVIHNNVYTYEIISCVKPDLLSWLKSVASGAA